MGSVKKPAVVNIDADPANRDWAKDPSPPKPPEAARVDDKPDRRRTSR